MLAIVVTSHTDLLPPKMLPRTSVLLLLVTFLFIRTAVSTQPTCTLPECSKCLTLFGNGPRDSCLSKWLGSVVKQQPEQSTNALCASSWLIVNKQLDDCHWMAHSIGLNLALNDVHPKLDTYLTWDTLRERARADYDQCEAVCLNGCKHAVTAVYIHEVVRRLNINPVVGDDHQYPSSLFSSLLEQVNKYCPESQILCDSRDTNCMDKVYACSWLWSWIFTTMGRQ